MAGRMRVLKPASTLTKVFRGVVFTVFTRTSRVPAPPTKKRPGSSQRVGS